MGWDTSFQEEDKIILWTSFQMRQHEQIVDEREGQTKVKAYLWHPNPDALSRTLIIQVS